MEEKHKVTANLPRSGAPRKILPLWDINDDEKGQGSAQYYTVVNDLKAVHSHEENHQ